MIEPREKIQAYVLSSYFAKLILITLYLRGKINIDFLNTEYGLSNDEINIQLPYLDSAGMIEIQGNQLNITKEGLDFINTIRDTEFPPEPEEDDGS